eukprot:6485694-Amphidinium_carterae.1
MSSTLLPLSYKGIKSTKRGTVQSIPCLPTCVVLDDTFTECSCQVPQNTTEELSLHKPFQPLGLRQKQVRQVCTSAIKCNLGRNGDQDVVLGFDQIPLSILMLAPS